MIRAAIIGVGYWGPNLLRNFFQNPDVHVQWICDNDSERLSKVARAYPGVETTTDANEVIQDTKVDLVVIATPVHSHYVLAEASLKAHKHVLVTKPITKTTTECLKLIELAEKYKRILMVDHTFVFHPAVQIMRQKVEAQDLGRLLYYQSARMNLGLYQPDVSVIYDLMPHDISILNELIDEDPIAISATAKQAAKLPQSDIAQITLNYNSDFMASVQVSWLSPYKVRLTTLTGSKKMIVYDDTDTIQKVQIFDKGVDTTDFSEKEKNYTNFIQYRQGDIHSPMVPSQEALKQEVEHLVECIKHSRTPITDGYAGLRVVRILECADALVKSNQCWVPLTNSLPTAKVFVVGNPGDPVQSRKNPNRKAELAD